LFSLLPIAVASTFGFQIDEIETEFLHADWTPEFSRSQDPNQTSDRGGRIMAVLMLSDSECRTAASQNNSNYGHQNTHISS
jgi:hypothetical protein